MIKNAKSCILICKTQSLRTKISLFTRFCQTLTVMHMNHHIHVGDEALVLQRIG